MPVISALRGLRQENFKYLLILRLKKAGSHKYKTLKWAPQRKESQTSSGDFKGDFCGPVAQSML